MKYIKRRKRSNINEALGNKIAVASLRHFGFRAHKISDVMGSHFTDKKPYDIFACSPKGRSIAIEGKLMKKWGKLNYKVFQPQQLIELDGNCLKCKGRSFVFLYVMIGDLHKVCVLDWEKHHKKIKTHAGISINELREMKIGKWYGVIQNKYFKDIYNIKGFLK